jgi:hypothetical protein
MFLMQRNVEDRDEYTWMFQHPYNKAILPEVSNSIKILNNLGAKNTRKEKIFAPMWKQLAALTWRANICAMRDPIVTVIRLVQTLFNAFIVLSIWWQISNDPFKAEAVHNRAGVLYFSAMFNFIPGMFMVLISCILYFAYKKKSPWRETFSSRSTKAGSMEWCRTLWLNSLRNYRSACFSRSYYRL